MSKTLRRTAEVTLKNIARARLRDQRRDAERRRLGLPPYYKPGSPPRRPNDR